jgi:hypothetical protein
VEGKDGRRSCSDKIGDARVESVSADQAEAILSQPATVAAGSTVRLK